MDCPSDRQYARPLADPLSPIPPLLFRAVVSMMYVSRWICTLAILVVAMHSQFACPDCWGVDELAGDSNLKITSGLGLWLDAARTGLAIAPSASGDVRTSVPEWRDLSGHHRSMVQPKGEDQPTLVAIGTDRVVRFDGESDHFRYVGPTWSSQGVTLYVVAAPHSNPGAFRGLVAANAPDQRDYESGFNVDLGPTPTLKLQQINIEGAGFGGARNLCNVAHAFGTLHTLEMVIDPQEKQVRLSIDGAPQGNRPFAIAPISLTELTLGARYFTNGPGEHQMRGPIAADIAEVLLFDRVLSPSESADVQAYLDTKYRRLGEQLPDHPPQRQGKPLVRVENPPAIQMLVPGFAVRELPLELTNVNNVRYRDDGKLMTLGYNGDVHLLSDTDGDGLEDHAEVFWKNQGSLRGPIGMILTPPNYPHGRGVIVPSKGKVSLIVDTDGDDRADTETVIAQGWQEIAQNVDAVGIAMDREGAIYFGLGTENYANAYLTDANGQSGYRVTSERGTVQRISPDFKQRTTLCTGVRFPIAFAFNEAGDLFCSEQEGATWLANGNPFDELLHIQPDRHYGFPPRHPKYNPQVIDEPSTFDYAPQHQSTCGMIFNAAVGSQRTFGPDVWQHNALVCGESRGKLWRTQLVKTDEGYIAASQLLACLQMLTIDACLAPDGDLVVACHSGPPDWGTGPAGIGKLFRIRMTEPERARPVLAWAESSHEIRIAFDRPIDPLQFRELQGRVKVEYGKYVRAGDRFENLVPPYAVVQQQMATPRFELPVAGVSITSDLRTMIVSTANMSANATYAVTIPQADGEMDIDFGLHGVHALWRSDTNDTLTSWLPHLALGVSQQLTQGSAVHAELWKRMHESGTLTLTTQLDLHHMLRPKIQPGATIDYPWPQESVDVLWTCDVPFSIQIGDKKHASEWVSQSAHHRVMAQFSGDDDAPQRMTIEFPHRAPKLPTLHVSYSTNEDARARPFPLSRFYLPQMNPSGGAHEVETAKLPVAGNWGRGRRIFHSESAKCSKCHATDGQPGKIGPDLSNLVFRDSTSVLRDIVQPSFSINPDYISHVLETDDGEVLVGVLRTENGELILGDSKGGSTRLDRNRIQAMKPSRESIMPRELLTDLPKEDLQDLMKFLLTQPPRMPLEGPLKAPPVRSIPEVNSALAGSLIPPADESLKALHMVLVAGPKDHGVDEHDYPAWQIQWGQLLSAAPQVSLEMAWEFPSEAQLQSADIVVFFQKGAWTEARSMAMDRFFQKGGGAVYVHWAVNGDDAVLGFSKRIGLASRGTSINYRHGPLELTIPEGSHPIVRNFQSLQLYDESYWSLTGELKDVQVLAWSREDGKETPQMWTYEPGKGRVFVSIPGHYNWTFDDPLFRILLLRGIAWTAREPIDRFNVLVPLGARLK